MLNYKGSKSNTNNDLSKSRIKKDYGHVTKIIEVMTENFIHPFSNSELVCISNGPLASTDVTENLLNAQKHGAEAMKNFMVDRLEEGAPVDFYEPMKKKNLKTFSHMRKVVKVSVKDRMVPLNIHRNIFGQISIIMQSRNIDLKEVFKYPLGPLPWTLAGDVGKLRKKIKFQSYIN